MKRAILLAILLLGFGFEVRAADGDGDGVPDGFDNCLTASNSKQLDPDQDGFGNSCDGDFDEDGDTDQDDVDYLTSCTSDPACDLNEDGSIGNFADIGAMAALVGSPPGPSGLNCAGTIPCSASFEVPALGGAGIGALLVALLTTAFALRRKRLAA